LLYYAKQDKMACALNLIVGNGRTKTKGVSDSKNIGIEGEHRQEQ